MWIHELSGDQSECVQEWGHSSRSVDSGTAFHLHSVVCCHPEILGVWGGDGGVIGCELSSASG